MSYCTECGARLGAAARFCAECGAALQAIPHTQVAQAVAAPLGVNGTEQIAPGARAVPPAQAVTLGDELASTEKPAANTARGAGEHAVAEATSAGTPRATIRLSELTSAQTTAASKDALLTLASVAGILMVSVAIAAGIFAPQGHHGSPADWLRTAVLILGLGMHAPAELHVAVAAGQATATNATIVVGATFTPLVVTALVGFGCFWFARRTERRIASQDIKAAATASVLTGAVFAGATALLAMLASGMPGFGLTGALALDSSTTVSLGINPWYLLPTTFVIAGVGTFLGRATALARTRGVTMSHLATTKISPWLVDLRTAKNLIFGATAVAALGLVCIFGWSGIQAIFTSDSGGGASTSVPQVSDTDTKTVIGALLGGALLLPNLVVTFVGSVLGGTLGFSGSGSARTNLLDSAPQVADLSNGIGLFTGGVPTIAYLILLPMTLMALALGIRAATQRPPEEAYSPHVWRTSALFAGAWVLFALLVRVSVNVSGNAAALSQSGDSEGSAAIGLGLPSILVAAFLWGTVAALGGALIARFVAAALPKPISWLGG